MSDLRGEHGHQEGPERETAPCPACAGRGEVEAAHMRGCRGEGACPCGSEPCPKCHGTGQVEPEPELDYQPGREAQEKT